MEAVIPRAPVLALSRRRLISIAVIGMSVGLTAVMSFIFHGEARPDMLATGFICAVIIDQMIRRITRRFRRQVARLQAELEQRVIERTAELTAMRTELHVRDRLATAGTLAAGVCHEVRSPLAVLMLGLEELGDAPLDEAQRAVLADLCEATDRMSVIVKDLSSLARPGSEELTPVELVPVIESAARMASYKFDSNVTVEKVLGEIPMVTGNAGRLGQVVLNLLTNAARATREGVRNTIRVSTRATADTVTLVIADTGTGMSPQTLQRLFEPFFTTGADRGGTGLGLAICRSIVERMGGTITIASELGAGTSVDVALRRA
jgi:two-component system, NtrC family, sensor kinase